LRHPKARHASATRAGWSASVRREKVHDDSSARIGSIHYGEAIAMKQKTLMEILAAEEGSVDAVLGVIQELREQLRQGNTADWENPTLESFLEAMHAWLETMGLRIAGKPSWKFVEVMLQAAKIYE
jgi:hypothetical protein